MEPGGKKLLFDVEAACEAVAKFTAGRTLEAYREDDLLRSATERKFEIIGEAITRLKVLDPGVFERITEGAAIVGFRNRLIHGYDSVDDAIVWDVVQRKLPALSAEVDRLLKE